MNRRSPRGRRVALYGSAGLSTALLCGVAVWSALGAGPGEEAASGPLVVEPSSAPRSEAAAASVVVTSGWSPQMRASVGAALLDASFLRSHGGRLRQHVMRDSLSPRPALTVVNVWADYCEPCKRELVGFAARQASWGRDVQFVPIEQAFGDPSADPPAMLEQWHSLLDVIPGGAVQGVLRDHLPAHTLIPITLVLDCHDHLQWIHVGEISGATWQEFDDLVARLRDDLRAAPKTCARQAPAEPSRSQAPRQEPANAKDEPISMKPTRICRINDNCMLGCACESGLKCNIGSQRCPATLHD